MLSFHIKFVHMDGWKDRRTDRQMDKGETISPPPPFLNGIPLICSFHLGEVKNLSSGEELKIDCILILIFSAWNGKWSLCNQK